MLLRFLYLFPASAFLPDDCLKVDISIIADLYRTFSLLNISVTSRIHAYHKIDDFISPSNLTNFIKDQRIRLDGKTQQGYYNRSFQEAAMALVIFNCFQPCLQVVT